MPKYGTFANTEEKVLALTGAFEGKGGFSNVTGSFDDMGISFGVLQWNLGKGTLQPLLKAMAAEGRETFRRCFTQPVKQFGGKVVDLSDDILKVCDMPAAEAVAWAEARQDEYHRMHDHWVAAFKALGEVPGFRKVQLRFAKRYMDRAKKYMKDAFFGFKSERALCLFFDICVQMGSISKGSRDRYAKALLQSRTVCEEQRLILLAKAMPGQVGRPGDDKEWIRRDVLSRKLTIAKGGGVVHQRPYHLERDFGITMAEATYA